MTDQTGWGAVFDRYLDPLATVILGLAALLTAWSGYQSAQWDAAKAAAYAAAAATARKEASLLDLRAGQQFQIDWSVFQAYLQARLHDDRALAGFYRQRLPPRLERVFAEWEAQLRTGDPDTPPHPFTLPGYVLPNAEAARAQTERAEAFDAEAGRATRVSGRYTRTTLGFAVVLFFAGLAPRGTWRGSRVFMMAISLGFLLAASESISRLPVILG